MAPLLRQTGIAVPVRIEVEPGISFLLDPEDVIERRILAKGIWRREIWSWVASHLSPGATMVDVGAHIGDISLRAARAVGPTGVVVAIEPHPALAARLRDNVTASGLSNVHVWEVACSDEAGRAYLYAGPSINLGASSLSRQSVLDHEGDGDVRLTVDLMTLDQIVDSSNLSRVNVVKVDAQGAELRLLRGATKTIRRFRPAIVVEAVDSRPRNLGGSVAMLEAHPRQLRYEKSCEGPMDVEWTALGTMSETEN